MVCFLTKKNINQLKAGSLLTYVTLFISSVIPLLYTPVMLRILGQSEYGLYSLSNSIISYLSLLTFGLGTSIMRYMMKYKVAKDKVMFERVAGLFILIYLVIGVIVCIVGFFLSIFTDTFFAKGLNSAEISKLKILIIIMTVSTAISFVSSVYSNIIICFEKYIFRRLSDMILTIAAPVLNLVVLFMGMASIGMATIGLVLQILTFFVNYLYSKYKLDVSVRLLHPPVELLKSIFNFTIFVFIGMIADLLYWATDKVLIGSMIGTVAVAIYNVGSTFNSMLQNLAAAISSVFSPRVNTLVFEEKPMEELSDLMIRVGRLQYLIVSLVLSGFIVFGRKFIEIWAGKSYGDAYTIALLTMIPLAIPLIQNIAFTAICAMKKHKFRSILYVVLAVANVIGTYILIPYMGIVGAALCTCVVFILGHGIIMNWYYYKKIGVDILSFWKNILQMSIIPIVMIVAYLLFERYILGDYSSLLIMLVYIVIYTLVFCLLSWIFSMNRYEKDLVLGFVKKFKLRKGK